MLSHHTASRILVYSQPWWFLAVIYLSLYQGCSRAESASQVHHSWDWFFYCWTIHPTMTVSLYHWTMLLRACHHLIFHSRVIWFCLSFTRRQACVQPFRIINRWCCSSGSKTGKTHTGLRSVGQRSVQQYMLMNFTSPDLSALRVEFSTLTGFSR